MQTVDGDLDTTAQEVDLYREVHKGLRSALFQLTVAAGALDSDDGDTLFAVMMEIRGSVPPPEMCVFLSYMLPAMNIDERTSTLGGMKAGAPPEVFDMFWDTAQSCLGSDDLTRVADRIGM